MVAEYIDFDNSMSSDTNITEPDMESFLYKGALVRLDGSFVITRNGNPYHVPNEGEWAEEWQIIHDWVLEHPDDVEYEIPPPPPEPPTPEEQAKALQKTFTNAIQKRLDNFARTRNYDNALACASYVASTNPQFAAEARYMVEARDAAWTTGYAILDAVMSGERDTPTWGEVEAELPVLTWPDEGESTTERTGE